jgi:hypothetical protein
MLVGRSQKNNGVAMERKYKWLGIGLLLLAVGHYLQLRGLDMSAQHQDHATEQGQARLQSRIGRTYWVGPNAHSTYQVVRFGDENTAESITHGVAIKDTESFTVIRLSTRPNSDSGTYQVRFADGTLKWMDSSSFNIHLYAPRVKVKVEPEIFEQDPRIMNARVQEAQDSGENFSLGPDPTKPSAVSFGMTERQILASDWGKPNSKSATLTPTGTVEGWFYAGGDFLTFRDGRLEEVLNDM